MNDQLKKNIREKRYRFAGKNGDSREIILSYLQNYYQTRDEYYLKEAMQLAKDEFIDFQSMLSIARNRLN